MDGKPKENTVTSFSKKELSVLPITQKGIGGWVSAKKSGNGVELGINNKHTENLYFVLSHNENFGRDALMLYLEYHNEQAGITGIVIPIKQDVIVKPYWFDKGVRTYLPVVTEEGFSFVVRLDTMIEWLFSDSDALILKEKDYREMVFTLIRALGRLAYDEFKELSYVKHILCTTPEGLTEIYNNLLEDILEKQKIPVAPTKPEPKPNEISKPKERCVMSRYLHYMDRDTINQYPFITKDVGSWRAISKEGNLYKADIDVDKAPLYFVLCRHESYGRTSIVLFLHNEDVFTERVGLALVLSQDHSIYNFFEAKKAENYHMVSVDDKAFVVLAEDVLDWMLYDANATYLGMPSYIKLVTSLQKFLGATMTESRKNSPFAKILLFMPTEKVATVFENLKFQHPTKKVDDAVESTMDVLRREALTRGTNIGRVQQEHPSISKSIDTAKEHGRKIIAQYEEIAKDMEDGSLFVPTAFHRKNSKKLAVERVINAIGDFL